MKKSIKIHFNDWKAVSGTMELSNYFISFNGKTQKVTVKNLKNENPRLKTRTKKVQMHKRKYTYEGIMKVRNNGVLVQKIVFQGTAPEDRIFYNLWEASLTLENENILIGKIL